MRALLLASALLAAACASPPGADRSLLGAADAIASTQTLPDGVQLREAIWYSEQVRIAGRLFLPYEGRPAEKTPAVILAPGEGATANMLDAYAIALAKNGIIALSIDYRGWGRSGGHIYLGERVDVYDRMRFSEQTPELIIRRGRIDPDHQVQDLRNAITFIQSFPTVDRDRIGVLGVGLGGGHVVSVMGMDARVKAGAAISAVIAGHGETPLSFVPDAATQAEMIRLARDGAPPRTAAEGRRRNALENRIALAEYKPFWRIPAIPDTAAIRFISPESSAADARAAATALGARGDLSLMATFDAAEAARRAAEWFREKL